MPPPRFALTDDWSVAQDQPQCFVFEFPISPDSAPTKVYVAPLRSGAKHGSASHYEAFTALANIRTNNGENKEGLKQFHAVSLELFGADTPDLGGFVAMVQQIRPEHYAVGFDLRKIKAALAAAHTPPPRTTPRLCITNWIACIHQGCTVGPIDIELVHPPRHFYSLIVEPHCPSGGVLCSPPSYRLTPNVLVASFHFEAVSPGTHHINFLVRGVNAVDVVHLPPQKVEVTGYHSVVILSTVEVLQGTLGTCPPHCGEKGREAFRSAVTKLLSPGVAARVVVDILRSMASRGFYRLLVATLNAIPSSLLEKVCNESVLGVPLLHVAMIHGDEELALRLLACEIIDPAARDTCIAAGIAAGQVDCALHVLVAHCGIPIDGRLNGGDTALCLAIKSNEVHAVHTLISAGADVNLPGGNGMTPLSVCYSFHKNADVRNGMVAEVLRSPAVEWVGREGRRNAAVLRHVAMRCHSDLVKMLLEAGCPYHADGDYNSAVPLYNAVMVVSADRDKQVETVSLLAASNVDCLGPDGLTALHVAAARRNLTLVNILMNAGARPTEPDVEGQNAFHHVLIAKPPRPTDDGDEQSEADLEKKGEEGEGNHEGRDCTEGLGGKEKPEECVEKDVLDAHSSTAVSDGRASAEESADQKEGEEGEEGKEKRRKAEEAAQRSYEAVEVIARMMMSATRAKADTPNARGNTPVHLASGELSGKPDVPVLATLLQYGFRLDVANAAGRSPLHSAISCCSNENREVVIEACALILETLPDDVEPDVFVAPDDTGMIPFLVAIKKGLLRLVEIICTRFPREAWIKVVEPGTELTPLLLALLYTEDPQNPKLSLSSIETVKAMASLILATRIADLSSMKTYPFSSPLLLACSRRQHSITKLLLESPSVLFDCPLGHTPYTALLGAPPYNKTLPPDDPAQRRDMVSLLNQYPAADINAAAELASGVRRVPFQMACSLCDVDLVRLFCKNDRLRWSFEFGDEYKEHPLMLILRSSGTPENKEACVELVLTRFGTSLAPETELLGLLIEVADRCCKLGLVQAMSSLLALQPILVDTRLNGGITLLQRAIASRHSTKERRMALAELLLGRGVDLNNRGYVEGVGTALQEAVRKGMWSVVMAMCKAGTGINVSATAGGRGTPAILLALGFAGTKPLEVANAVCAMLATGTVEAFDAEPGESLGEQCCFYGLAATVHPLYQKGFMHAPVEGPTYLHMAIASDEPDEKYLQSMIGPTPTLKALQDIGILTTAMEIPDRKEQTPLFSAFAKGKSKEVRFLLSRGADPTVLAKGHSMLYHGVASQKVKEEEILQCILSLRTSCPILPHINLACGGEAPLHVACKRGFASVLEVLLQDSSIWVNEPDENGLTPLALVLGKVKDTAVREAMLGMLLSHSCIDPTAGLAAQAPLQTLMRLPLGPDLTCMKLLTTPNQDTRGYPIWTVPVLAAPDKEGMDALSVAADILSQAVQEKNEGAVEKAFQCFEYLIKHPRLPPVQITSASQKSALYHLVKFPLGRRVSQALGLLVARGGGGGSHPADIVALQVVLQSLIKLPAESINGFPEGAAAAKQIIQTVTEARAFDPAVRDKTGCTLLHQAMQLPHREIAVSGVLRVLGLFRLQPDVCDLNAKDSIGNTALMRLTMNMQLGVEGMEEILRHLMQLPELDPTLDSEGTILHFIATCRRSELFLEFLSSPALLRHVANEQFWRCVDSGGRSVLHCAVAKVNDAEPPSVAVTMVKGLLEHSQVMDLAMSDLDGVTPLFLALSQRMWDVAWMILGAPAGPRGREVGIEVKDPSGSTTLHVALKGSPAQEAMGWIEALAPRIVEAHGELDTMCAGDGKTVLHIAAERGLVPCCQELISRYQCSCSVCDAGGNTPLMLAMQATPISQRVVLTLIDQEALNVPNASGATPLMEACRAAAPDLVSMFLSMGCSVTARDSSGRSALDHALNPAGDAGEVDANKTVLLVLSAMRQAVKKSTWLSEINGRVLNEVIRRANLEAAWLLLEEGCDPSIPDDKGITPLEALLSVREKTIAVVDSNLPPDSTWQALAVVLVEKYSKENPGAPVPGIEVLKEVRPSSNVLFEQVPVIVAKWLEYWFSKSTADSDGEITERYMRYFEASMQCKHSLPTAELRDGRCQEDIIELLVQAVQLSPQALKHSDRLKTRYCCMYITVLLSHPSIRECITGSVFFEGVDLHGVLACGRDAVTSLILLSTDLENAKIILPPTGVYFQPRGAPITDIRNLLEAAVLFANDLVLETFSRHAKHLIDESCDESLARLVVSLGTEKAVEVLLKSAPPSSGRVAMQAFFERPVPERSWDVFAILLDQRVNLSEEALLFMLDNKKIGWQNTFGDTVIHLLALNSEEHLLRGLVHQVAHVGEFPLDPDAKNVFGKKAIDYSDGLEMARSIRELKRPARLRDARSIIRSPASPTRANSPPPEFPSRLTPCPPPSVATSNPPRPASARSLPDRDPLHSPQRQTGQGGGAVPRISRKGRYHRPLAFEDEATEWFYNAKCKVHSPHAVRPKTAPKRREARSRLPNTSRPRYAAARHAPSRLATYLDLMKPVNHSENEDSAPSSPVVVSAEAEAFYSKLPCNIYEKQAHIWQEADLRERRIFHRKAAGGVAGSGRAVAKASRQTRGGSG